MNQNYKINKNMKKYMKKTQKYQIQKKNQSNLFVKLNN